jgi:EF hand
MRKLSWLGFAALVIITVACFEGSDAQPPGKKGGFGKKGGGPVTAAQIVERIMSYDKNNDGKVTVDELPERMQHLVAMGDINKDGALDREEVRKLAETLESFVDLAGGGLPGGGAKGDKGGFKGDKGGFKGAEVRKALDELDLRGATRDKADGFVRAYQDKLKKFEEVSRAELAMQMKEILSEADYRSFKASLDRPPPPKGFKGPNGPPPPPPGDLTSRIDQLQKELDDLRRKVQTGKEK